MHESQIDDDDDTNNDSITINVNMEQVDDNNSKSLLSILERRAIRSLDWLCDAISNAGAKTVSNRRMGKSHGVSTWADEEEMNKSSSLKPATNGRLLRMHFAMSASPALPWSLMPTQSSIKVMPGETHIDPEFVDDPCMDRVNSIALSYAFFKTDEEEEE